MTHCALSCSSTAVAVVGLAAMIVSILVALSVFGASGLGNLASINAWTALVSLSLILWIISPSLPLPQISFSGSDVILPNPVFIHPGSGTIGSVDINHLPNVSIDPQILLPIEPECILIAVKTNARINHTATRLTISHENRSIVPHRLKLSISTCCPAMRYFVDQALEGTCIICGASAVEEVVVGVFPLGGGFNVLISVVMKIMAKLRAKTVTTGAKITDKMFLIPSVLVKESGNPSVLSKTAAKTMNGDAAITSQRKPTLAIKTTASAMSGKRSINAKAVLMIISPDTFPKLSLPVSEISAKLRSEE